MFAQLASLSFILTMEGQHEFLAAIPGHNGGRVFHRSEKRGRTAERLIALRMAVFVVDGFRTFLKRAGITSLPRIVASGSRQAAFHDFCTEVKAGGEAALLVDSEDLVKTSFGKPWNHLKKRDGWTQPPGSDDSQCHLMVVCMEAWFQESLKTYYGKGFKPNALPANPKIEKVPKSDIFVGLEKATKDTQKGRYSKGDHSFRILCQIDPGLVCHASPWAQRLVESLKS